MNMFTINTNKNQLIDILALYGLEPDFESGEVIRWERSDGGEGQWSFPVVVGYIARAPRYVVSNGRVRVEWRYSASLPQPDRRDVPAELLEWED